MKNSLTKVGLRYRAVVLLMVLAENKPHEALHLNTGSFRRLSDTRLVCFARSDAV